MYPQYAERCTLYDLVFPQLFAPLSQQPCCPCFVSLFTHVNAQCSFSFSYKLIRWALDEAVGQRYERPPTAVINTRHDTDVATRFVIPKSFYLDLISPSTGTCNLAIDGSSTNHLNEFRIRLRSVSLKLGANDLFCFFLVHH
jgi:hypothetical protein